MEDLFYNVAVRRKAFKSPSEEHSKIADMISKYAIHNPAVGFSLKKFGESIAHIRTPSNSSILNNIKIVYGPTVSRELLEISQKDEKLAYEMKGYISNANYSVKKLEFLLFINHRLVESSSLSIGNYLCKLFAKRQTSICLLESRNQPNERRCECTSHKT